MSLTNFFKKNGITDVISVIDTVLVYSDKFRDVDSLTIGVGPSTFDAFSFLRILLEKFLGRDELIRTLSKFITFQIPVIEVAVKAVMMVKLNQFNKLCTLKNTILIPDRFIKNGIRMSVREVDTMGMLHRSPLNVNFNTTDKYTLDKYYYFGNDSFKVYDELKESPDMNSFLWYILNVSEGREGWYGSILHEEEVSDKHRQGKLKKEKRYYNRPSKKKKVNKRGRENDFLCTLVSNDGLNYATADGILLHGSQRPNTSGEFTFYFGNALEVEYDERNRYQSEQRDLKKRLSLYTSEIERYDNLIREKNDRIIDIKNSVFTEENVAKIMDFYDKKNENKLKEIAEKDKEVNRLKVEIKEHEEDLEILVNKSEDLRKEITDKKSEYRQRKRELTYPRFQENRYYRMPIQKFNFDYLYNTKLMDERIIAVQIVEMLFNLKLNVTFEAGLTYQEIAIANEVRKMVKSVLDTDEAIVSDCFFSFDNDEFNALLEETERQFSRQGYLSQTKSNDIVKTIFENIDNITPTSDKNVNEEIINDSLQAIMTGYGYSYEFTDKDKISLDGNVDVDFDGLLKQLIEGLCVAITTSILSPKIIMLMIVNKRVNDGNVSVDFIGWLKSARGLIIAIIRKVKDLIIEFLVGILNEKLLGILEEIAILYTKEQLEYYVRLIKKMIDCLNSQGGDLNFRADKVNTADIYDQGKPSKKNDC